MIDSTLLHGYLYPLQKHVQKQPSYKKVYPSKVESFLNDEFMV